MTQSIQIQKGNARWYVIVLWVIVAAVAAIGCVVLPPYLVRGSVEHSAYGWPLFPWFAVAYANLRVLSTMCCFFGLGIALGIAQPRWWPLLCLSALGSPIVLNGINMVHDWTRHPTSHNLWPFEVVAFVFICSPVLVGGLLGFLLRRLLDKRQAALTSDS